jgi:hypothetical protein
MQLSPAGFTTPRLSCEFAGQKPKCPSWEFGTVPAALGTYFNRIRRAKFAGRRARKQIGEFMRRGVLQLQNAVLRPLAVSGLALLISIGSATAQSGAPAAADQSGKPAAGTAPDAATSQHKTDEFVEAAQAINGPAGNPECVWLGRRVVRLMWRDDLDTAFRHLDLYDRFGCPGGHIQAAFRCLTRFGSQIDDKVPKSLDDRVHACWINPAAQPQTAAAATPAPAPTTAGAAPAAATPQPAPSATPAPAK